MMRIRSCQRVDGLLEAGSGRGSRGALPVGTPASSTGSWSQPADRSTSRSPDGFAVRGSGSIAVAYTQIVTISTDNILKTNEFRDSVGAQWTCLSDAGRKVQ